MQHFFLDDRRATCRQGLAAGPAACRVRAAGASPAAHRGADRRLCTRPPASPTLLCRSRWTQWWKCSRSSTSWCLMSSRSSKCPRFFSTRSCSVSSLSSWRNSWWKCRRSCLSLSGFSRVLMGTCGGSSRGLWGPTDGGWAPLIPSGPPPPGVQRQARAV